MCNDEHDEMSDQCTIQAGHCLQIILIKSILVCITMISMIALPVQVSHTHDTCIKKKRTMQKQNIIFVHMELNSNFPS